MRSARTAFMPPACRPMAARLRSGLGTEGPEADCGRRIVVVGAAHAHAHALKHDPVQRHRVARLLHCIKRVGACMKWRRSTSKVELDENG